MIRRVVARAFANIALCKYWGKQSQKDNLPATPSISIALERLLTRTEVSRISGNRDQFYLNGLRADARTAAQLTDYLDYWRRKNLIRGRFQIKSENQFPTQSGLASSSSGYAALAKALAAFSGKKISQSVLSRLARVGSGSAARSIPGGLAKLPVAANPIASQILAPHELPWGIIPPGSGKLPEIIGRCCWLSEKWILP